MNTQSWFRRHIILTLIGIVILVVIIGSVSKKKQSGESVTPAHPADTSLWDKVRSSDPPVVVSGGWAEPVRLGVSEDGMWEDGLFVSLDGKTIYFNYYPGDLLADLKNWKIKDSAKTYYSQTPFTTKTRDTNYFMAENSPYSSGGPSVAADGNVFYQSNRPAPGDDKSHISRIYKNDTLLPFNDARDTVEFNNAKYCSGKDELWMDSGDKQIYVLKNAKATGFEGVPELAPQPINSSSPSIQNNQPWLSDDCNTLYFGSTRAGTGAFGIYTSKRAGADSWSVPELVVSSKFGVDQPSLTGDMKKLFFMQVLQNSAGAYTTNLFYVEKK